MIVHYQWSQLMNQTHAETSQEKSKHSFQPGKAYSEVLCSSYKEMSSSEKNAAIAASELDTSLAAIYCTWNMAIANTISPKMKGIGPSILTAKKDLLCISNEWDVPTGAQAVELLWMTRENINLLYVAFHWQTERSHYKKVMYV